MRLYFLKMAISLLLLICTQISTATAAPIVNFKQFDETLFRGGRISEAEHFETLRAHGIRTILNLRSIDSDAADPEMRAAQEAGFHYVRVPLGSFFPTSLKQIRKALEVVANPANHPVYVHCRRGRDRTGLVLGLYRVYVEGWEPRKAYQEMIKYGFTSWFLGIESAYWNFMWYNPELKMVPCQLKLTEK